MVLYDRSGCLLSVGEKNGLTCWWVAEAEIGQHFRLHNLMISYSGRLAILKIDKLMTQWDTSVYIFVMRTALELC